MIDNQPARPKIKIPFTFFIPIALIAMCCQIFFCLAVISGIVNPQPTSTPTLTATIAQTSTSTPPPTQTPPPTITPTLAPVPTQENKVFAPQTCIRPQVPQYAKVVDVVDGDTIRVELDGVVYPVGAPLYRQTFTHPIICPPKRPRS